MKQKGTELFASALISEGVEILFGYPGGFAIDLFDALYEKEEIEIILPRHEQGLIHAADGYARSTGKTGVCLVTSGPGATNLITGIATANYDSVPLVCFTGQVPTALIGNDAFQEVDIVGMTRNICKYSVTVRNRKDLGRIIKEAFYIARTGKPGPVLVDIPKDVQLACEDDEYPESVQIRGYKPQTQVHQGQIKKAAAAMREARRPLFLAGGGIHVGRAEEAFTALVSKTGIPVVSTIMGKGAIDSKAESYLGNLGMHGSYGANMAVTECDLLIAVGCRFNDRITSQTESFAPNAKIIHMDIDPAAISKNVTVDIPIVGEARMLLEELERHSESCYQEEWVTRVLEWKQKQPLQQKMIAGMTPEKIIAQINAQFEQALVVTDVGQHQMWAAQYLDLNEKKKLLTSGGLGGMGYGLPAAIGAKLGNPDQEVICISGDGGIQMNIQELATAAICELPLIICIFNNTYLGMVRQWQELFYDERYAATCCRRRRSCPRTCKGPGQHCPPYLPDFMALAGSYGAYGIRVEEENEIEAAFALARRNNGPTVIEFLISEKNMVLPMVKGGNPLTDMIMEV